MNLLKDQFMHEFMNERSQQTPTINKNASMLEERSLKKTIHSAVLSLSENGYLNYDSFLNVL